ncbi:MAG: Mannosylglycerate hydrolase [Acidimicrobiales bacterium]|nr:Mannosylglycerate hydrolase [Acidimicrobiales bacterium]
MVPHTHWDREWYAPFQTFRLELVDLLDELLPRLEADPSFGHFMLDGQMAVVDDYLAVRPESESRLRRLATSGRLAMGPWYILMDEFLVSGETILRNLRKGMERAGEFGGAIEVGYLPDMFGHIAQMPQILSQFGLEHAVVWRGVPRRVHSDAFWWASPDGSVVRAQYLPQGYGNGAQTPRDPARLVRRVDRFLHDYGELVPGSVLWMAGTDHEVPRPWLGEAINGANRIQDEYRFHLTSLPEHLTDAPTAGLQVLEGELRSGARANLLMGVLSNRVDVKQAAARAELSIERLAEPLAALFGRDTDWPEALLAEAWTEIVRNSAHDSICACSLDEVCTTVIDRYASARRIGEGLSERALAAFATQLSTDGPVIVNPSSRTRAGLIEIDLPGEGEPDGHQLLRQWAEEVVLHSTTASSAAVIVERELSIRDKIHSVDIAEVADSVNVTLISNSRRRGRLRKGEALDELRELAAAAPSMVVNVMLHRDPHRLVLAMSGEVAGYGWREWHAVRAGHEVRAGRASLENGVIVVAVADDATFSLNGHPSLGRLVDGGDVGDTYNYCPPQRDTVIDAPEDLVVQTQETGPLRGRLCIRARYRLPEHADEHCRSGERMTEILTTLEVRAEEPFVRVETSFENCSRDHRLRAHFKLPERATRSVAECAFTTVTRGLTAEGGPTEEPLPTFPSRRFVSAGGLTIVHEGLHEYELVEIDEHGRAGRLALTLLRATGMLSRGPMSSRPLPAGPEIPLAGSQMPGPHRVRYAVHIGDEDPYRLVEQFSVPLKVVSGHAQGKLAATGRHLAVAGAEVSAVYRRDGALHVRLFNPTGRPTTVHLEGQKGWLVDLLDRRIATFSEDLELEPHRIATVVLG